jgi:hypothetical protein
VEAGAVEMNRFLGVRSGDQSEKEPMPPTCPPLLFSSFIMYGKYSFNSFQIFSKYLVLEEGI